MSSSKNHTAMLLGTLIGFSIAFGIVLFRNKELNDEVARQANSVLKTTGKFVRYYRGAADYLADNDDVSNELEQVRAYNNVWKKTLEAVNEHED